MSMDHAANPTEEMIERLSSIFMPYSQARRAFVKNNKLKFVHYTTAENALDIWRSRRIYLRNTVCMNDYREFRHGLDYLLEIFHEETSRKQFINAINLCGEGLAEEALGLFDQWLPRNEFNLFVTCLSEHDPLEDEIGRLSMWRAYNKGGSVGVALVLNQEPFWLASPTANVFGSPVSYMRAEEFRSEFEKIITNVRENVEFLSSLPRQALVWTTYIMLAFAAACSKHPGFREEREWRLIHLPNQFPSAVLERSVEAINGIPQTIYKFPLVDRPEHGLVGIEPDKVLDKVIIGPSNFPYPVFEAFVAELADAGVKDPASRIVTSSIPLRT